MKLINLNFKNIIKTLALLCFDFSGSRLNLESKEEFIVII